MWIVNVSSFRLISKGDPNWCHGQFFAFWQEACPSTSSANSSTLHLIPFEEEDIYHLLCDRRFVEHDGEDDLQSSSYFLDQEPAVFPRGQHPHWKYVAQKIELIINECFCSGQPKVQKPNVSQLLRTFQSKWTCRIQVRVIQRLSCLHQIMYVQNFIGVSSTVFSLATYWMHYWLKWSAVVSILAETVAYHCLLCQVQQTLYTWIGCKYSSKRPCKSWKKNVRQNSLRTWNIHYSSSQL